VSDECLELYHQFASEGNRCSPERVKPAPKRRRGESSAEWLAVRTMDVHYRMLAELIYSAAMVYYCLTSALQVPQLLSFPVAALVEGCKVPNFDWDMARAIAISELVRSFHHSNHTFSCFYLTGQSSRYNGSLAHSAKGVL
jgi:hypothetical protein